jgi:hypothetical protein
MTLEHFDTILAFMLIITGVSLIITILNQMVSAFLGLRGTHLRWGIKTLLARINALKTLSSLRPSTATKNDANAAEDS